jgi:hypothetical protein
MKRQKFASLVILGLSILFYLFFDFCKHTPALGSTNPFGEDPYDAVGSFGIFLTFVSAVLTLLRAFHPSQQKEATGGQVWLFLRAGTVALLTVVVTLAADAIGLARAVVMSGTFPAAGPLAGLVGGMALVTLAAGWFFIQTARSVDIPEARRPWRRAGIISGMAILILTFYPPGWRESSVPGGIITALVGMVLLFVTVWGLATVIFPAAEFEYEDVFDELSAIILGGRNRPDLFAATIKWIGKLTSFPLVSGLLRWLNPRRHRWNLVLLTAMALGLAIVAAEVLAEGMPTNLGRALLVVSVYVSIGGAGVMLGYLLFGEYLGIFRVE